MVRAAGRSAEETKQLIVEAAKHMVGRQGRAVSLADIAAHAGVSKGGLLYHFACKEDLLRAVAHSLTEEFRKRVLMFVEEEKGNLPGKLTRAYIRASFYYAHAPEQLKESIRVAAELMAEPSLENVSQLNADQWRHQLLDDGLDASLVRVIVAAADGNTAAALWGSILDADDRVMLEETLLEMTRVNSASEAKTMGDMST